jgi:hypothetical protein
MGVPRLRGARAAHALAHGDLAAAAGLNLLFLLALPLVVVLWLRWVRARARGDDEPFAPMSTRLWVVALAAGRRVRCRPEPARRRVVGALTP